MAEPFDLIVIGAGPAGAEGAAQAAGLGKRVALVEREPYLGGSGLSTGTMPSKMLREAAVTLATLRQRGLSRLQYSLQPGTRLSDLLYQKDVVVDAAWGLIQRNCERLNIRIVRGTAAFNDAHSVVVRQPADGGPSEVKLVGDTLLVATGSTSVHPARFPFDHPQVRDTETILNLDRLPQSIAVIGGGTIGCEYASIFNALEVHVTVVEARPRILAPVDVELARRWQQHLSQRGMQFRLEEDVVRVESPDGGHRGDLRLTLKSGEVLTVDVVLVAVGRHGNVAGLNLEAAGLTATPQGLIPVSDHFQTAVPHIYAAGDVVGWPALASTSREQARVAMSHAFGQTGDDAATVYPLAMHTIPELAMVGLSEDACQQQNVAYAVGRAFFEDNAHAQMTGDTNGMLKLLFDPADRRLLGVQVMGESASDLIHLGAHVVATGGTLDAFTRAVYNYPTRSEAYQAAAFDGLARLRRASDLAVGH